MSHSSQMPPSSAFATTHRKRSHFGSSHANIHVRSSAQLRGGWISLKAFQEDVSQPGSLPPRSASCMSSRSATEGGNGDWSLNKRNWNGMLGNMEDAFTVWQDDKIQSIMLHVVQLAFACVCVCVSVWWEQEGKQRPPITFSPTLSCPSPLQPNERPVTEELIKTTTRTTVQLRYSLTSVTFFCVREPFEGRNPCFFFFPLTRLHHLTSADVRDELLSSSSSSP